MTQSELTHFINYYTGSANVTVTPVWAVYQLDTANYGWLSRAFHTRAMAVACAEGYGRVPHAIVCVEQDDHTLERIRIAPLLRRPGFVYVEIKIPYGVDTWVWRRPEDVDVRDTGTFCVAYSGGPFDDGSAQERHYMRLTNTKLDPTRLGHVTYYKQIPKVAQ